jgi:hypothetical protein
MLSRRFAAKATCKDGLPAGTEGSRNDVGD